jgi:hypothetical protein
MALDCQKHDAPDIEQLLRQYYQRLSAKDRRRWAAVAALTLGHGGTTSLAHTLGCDPPTMQEGLRERKQLPDDPAGKRVRKAGGGRKKPAAKPPAWLQHVQHTLPERSAGAPRRADVLWTDLTPQEIADSRHAHGVGAGPRLVRRLLETLGWARRQSAQVLPGGAAPHRAAQFRHLGPLLQEWLAAGHAVWRIDTKQKAVWGPLYREGKVSGQPALPAFEHAFPSLARGVRMPHGISDLARNHGWMHGGLSRDTTACAGESVRLLWHSDGRRLSPNASAILRLCDGGGSHRCHTHRCKEDRQDVVNDLAVPSRVAPYPAYGSKFNPIERRRCSHVPRACQGGLWDALQTVLGLLQKTKTQQGLSGTVRVVDKL